MISKKRNHAVSLSLVIFASAFPPAFAAAEPISFGYNTDDWYAYRSNAEVTFSSNENSITFSTLDASSYVWGYFPKVSLSVGESLSVTGTLTFSALSTSGTLMLGVFDSGNCSKADMITHAYQSKTDVSSMKNYSVKESGTAKNAVSTATGGMTGVSANCSTAYLRTNADSYTAFLSTASGAQQAKTSFSSEFSSPAVEAEYAFSLCIVKTAAGLDFSVALGEVASIQTVSFSSEISDFDALGIRSPVSSGGSITLSELAMTKSVIPEPSMFGIAVIVGALVFAVSRRRRNKDK